MAATDFFPDVFSSLEDHSTSNQGYLSSGFALEIDFEFPILQSNCFDLIIEWLQALSI